MDHNFKNMVLIIDTNDREKIQLSVEMNGKVLMKKSIKAKFKQAEKLLAGVEKMLIGAKINLKKIKEIRVENRGESFTSLRIGVITANALGYSLGVPVTTVQGGDKKTKKQFSIIKPEYSQEPNITISKK